MHFFIQFSFVNYSIGSGILGLNLILFKIFIYKNKMKKEKTGVADFKTNFKAIVTNLVKLALVWFRE
jgi:hypothetical protein